MWNKEGLEFYYTAEKNWREVYNSKEQFSVLINGWENWEPKDKSKKDVLRTYWMKDKEDDKKMSSEKNRPQEKHWWEVEDEGYNSDLNLKAEYDWEDKTIENISAIMGIEEEVDDDGVGGQGKDYDEDDGGKKGDSIENVNGKVVEGSINGTKEDDDNDKRGDLNPRSSNRGKK